MNDCVGQTLLDWIDICDGAELVPIFQEGTCRIDLIASCCESLSFDFPSELNDAKGLKLLSYDFVEGGDESDECKVYEYAFLNLKFGGEKGYVNVSITAHNNHNGYYGGFYLETQYEPNDKNAED